MADRKTIEVYDTGATDYADRLTSDKPYPRLEAFIDAMPEGGRVLDLGCGPGNAAARMMARGLKADALDASEAMAALALERYGVSVRVGTFDDITGAEIYDGVWAHFSLLHAPRKAFPRHLAAIRTALKAGGRFMVAMKSGEGEGADSLGRFYSYYGEEELVGMLEAAGFEVFEREFGEDKGFAGKLDPWIILHAVASPLPVAPT
ncbi:ubiquinone/menaquinone biosynthesis C-methylase UbiE [Aliiruegeria haliotis]|uniref:Ubiquinone/menaquinone biosynthesis C-methylase UbiE n=1 Tax=Aliiruegeria haliotis TaxID=1280846 RepID=A0A2T0RGH7_9RHOB|nr:class I SAM-dependent methyltransferase [Aliiruegeria haliotis]PRY20265.1 ubiquinone/menaquinone biosynthesis C-methylase UbiE [Aliiruegeria haliotis]